uniref:RanBP2-type domain-containing protein n=1 Tax=Angiostrongylus cantonensis TaxID=6313 RepID=A0A0K0D7V5_ANGCA
MSGTGKKRSRKDDVVATYDDCDAGSWECTVCTYRNRFEAFKCEMCDTRFVNIFLFSFLDFDLYCYANVLHCSCSTCS